jgi:hypothetical protein
MGDVALWSGIALAVVLAAVGGFALGRSDWAWRKPAAPVVASPLTLMAELIRHAAPLDLLPGSAGEPLARCLPKSIGPDGLLCDLLDSAGSLGLRPGLALTCFFAPLRRDGAKVNSFQTEVVEVHSSLELPQVLLRPPLLLESVSRRRHARKRVNDPRFVHVRLWAADSETSRLFFPEAAPDIWINAYDGQNGGENAVTDISPGGLSMELRAALLPPGMEPGSPVVLKCSLFQFKEKQFKSYWYAGLVRGISAPDEKTRRIAVGFTAVGALDGNAPQGVRWTERITNETQGGSA